MSKTVAVIDGSDVEVVELKDPVIAAILAWMIPGLGHFYQGRRSKGALFAICILSIFFYGLFISDGKAVYAAFNNDEWRLPYVCQAGVGLPAMPAVVQTYLVRRGHEPLFGGVMAPPASPAELNHWYKTLHRSFELGTVFTMIAGLLNVLAIYDAWGGPVPIDPEEEKKKRDGKKSADEGPPPGDTMPLGPSGSTQA